MNIREDELTLIEKKGDVSFFKDLNGKMFQKINETDKPFKVKNGAMSYKALKTINGYRIKYNTNGVHGFAIVSKAGTILEDNIWTMKDAERIANEL